MTPHHVRRFVMCAGLTLSVFSAAVAQQDKQPIAKELREAKSAHLMKSGVDPRLLDRFTKEITDWKRFTLTDDLKAADVMMTLSEEYLEAKGGQRPPVMIVLTITHGLGGPALWTDKERSGVTTGAAANLVKRLKDGLQRPSPRSIASRTTKVRDVRSRADVTRR